MVRCPWWQPVYPVVRPGRSIIEDFETIQPSELLGDCVIASAIPGLDPPPQARPQHPWRELQVPEGETAGYCHHTSPMQCHHMVWSMLAGTGPDARVCRDWTLVMAGHSDGIASQLGTSQRVRSSVSLGSGGWAVEHRLPLASVVMLPHLEYYCVGKLSATLRRSTG